MALVDDIEYIPLWSMTREHWVILEFDGLRAKAKNRICELAVTGALDGFYRVHVVYKARSKPVYLWPSTKGENKGSWDGFEYESDDESESDDTLAVEDLVDGLRFGGRGAVAAILTRLNDDVDMDPEAMVALSEINQENKLRLPEWRYLQLILMALLYLSYEEVESIILDYEDMEGW